MSCECSEQFLTLLMEEHSVDRNNNYLMVLLLRFTNLKRAFKIHNIPQHTPALVKKKNIYRVYNPGLLILH